MRISKSALRWTVASVFAGLILLCLGLALRTSPSTAATPSLRTFTPKATQGVRKTVNAGTPVRLKIPKIGVNAILEHVSLTPEGDLESPKEPSNAAWYSLGPRPGDSGNAVIDGHFGYKNHIPAVFDELHTLQPGDKIYVEDEKGITVAFAVRELRTYSPAQSTTDVFNPKDGRAYLNLITCKGAWNKIQESYSARLVVFTDKVTE